MAQKKGAGPLGNATRDLRDSFVGEPAELATGGPAMRWPPNPKRITTNTFHANVSGEASTRRADRPGHFRKGGWVSGKK